MKKIFLIILFTTSTHSLAQKLPKGWHIRGTNPQGYSVAVVHNEGTNPPVATIKSEQGANNHQFVTVLQRFYPQSFLGKRIKMSVAIKSDQIDAWAGAWLRIDDINTTTVAFDNMLKRPITGTSDWHTYAIVLDVPNNAESMNYGVLLSGTGQIWFDDFTFEAVSQDVAVTDMIADRQLKNSPINNSF